MLNTKPFLCFNFGAGSLKVAEFDQDENGQLRLRQFGHKPLGLAGGQDAARERVLTRAMQELLGEMPISFKNSNVCAPGFQIFSKLVKLPPVDASKVTQIIQYEAQQNVPFPLAEVAWDYQILGTAPGGELEVLLVAIKSDVVESIFRVGEASGLKISIVDVSPSSLTNAFRYNYGDPDGCVMVLDIGAKTSNVLFFEKGKVYTRSIPIGSNNITQEFAAEAKIPFVEAEKLKISDGFVSLGGAYAEPENPNQAAISKIARQVLTRLHLQINQTLQFYKGQQGGSTPQMLYLAGGGAILPYTAEFFAEKLSVGIEYFNPFRRVERDPSVDVDGLAEVAHSFGEVVGLGLRGIGQCPVELNLIPKTALKRQELNRKKPYFLATVLSLIVGILGFAFFYQTVEGETRKALQEVKRESEPLQKVENVLRREEGKVDKISQEINQLSKWIQLRFEWGDILQELNRVFRETEMQTEGILGVKTGIWIESFKPQIPGEESVMETSSSDTSSNPYAGMDRAMLERYGLLDQAEATGAGGGGEDVASNDDTNSISRIKLGCKAVNLKQVSPSANSILYYELEKKLKASPLFSAENTKLTGQVEVVGDDAPSFSFEVTAVLAKPIDL